MCCEHGGHLGLPQPKRRQLVNIYIGPNPGILLPTHDQPNTSLPLVEVGHQQRVEIFSGFIELN